MKTLFIIPPASLESAYGALRDFSNPQPSIGLAYLAAVLRKASLPVDILDAYVLQMGLEDLLREIDSRGPDIIGISVLSTSMDVVEGLIGGLRRQRPGCRIVLGNLHASLFAEDLLTGGLADFIVHREGEYTMLELVRTLVAGGDPASVQGLSFRRDGRVVHTPPRPPIDELDALPFPAWDLFPKGSYSTDPRTAVRPGKAEVQILATRGCPNACAFCSSRSERSLGSRYRMRSPSNVADEIEYMVGRYGAEVFSFMDLAFPLVKSHAMALFDEMIRRGLPRRMAWMTECRVRPLDQETLLRMRQAGCVRVNFGIESGSNRILKLLRKNYTVDDVRRAVRMAKRAGIDVDGMFMIGLPTETEVEIRQTIDFAMALDCRYAIFNIFVPYPGCEFHDRLSAEGKIHFERWSDFTSYPTYAGGRPVYVPDGLTHERLMKLQRYAMRRFYLRPRFVVAELRRFRLGKIRHYLSGVKSVVFGK